MLPQPTHKKASDVKSLAFPFLNFADPGCTENFGQVTGGYFGSPHPGWRRRAKDEEFFRRLRKGRAVKLEETCTQDRTQKGSVMGS